MGKTVGKSCGKRTILAQTLLLSLGQAFGEACGVEGQSPPRSSQRAKFSFRYCFFETFFLWSKKKLKQCKAILTVHRAFATYRRLSAFSFGTVGAKEKANKKKTPFLGCFARCDERPKALPLDTASLPKGLSETFIRGLCGAF